MTTKALYSCGWLLACFTLLQFPLKAQFYNLPGDYSFSLLTEKQLAKKDSGIHTATKPYIHFFSEKYVHVEDSHRIFKFIHDDPLLDIVFFKHLIRVEPRKENFKLRIDPIINVESGIDILDSTRTNLYTNTRGVIANGYVGDKFYFETMFSENQSVFPTYLSNTAKATSVVPGQGRWKQFKSKGFDYAFSSGFISAQVFKNLNIQVGHGKHKIGNGYRSLLLSDNSFNYPYARITQQWFKGRVQYTNIYAVLMNLVSATSYVNPNTERLFQKKAASFQYLSVNVTKFLNVGFFQGMIWKAGDNKNRQQLDWQYYSPVIYTGAAAYGLNGRNNVLVGGDIKLKLVDKLNLYGQWMLDNTLHDITLAGAGYQAGFNYFDAFGIKNLFLQTEFNNVTDRNTYMNIAGGPSDQSYTHYNQTLAYTPQNGAELLFVADYKFKRFFTNIKYHIQAHSTDASDPAGYSLNLLNAKVGYVINPAYNLNIMLGILYRKQNFNNFKPANNETNYIYVGFRTSIYNLYYDF